jgi:cellulose biosynthesis protein BcsQ
MAQLDLPDALEKVLNAHSQVVLQGHSREGGPRYSSYAVSNLRGGVGKTSLTFNLAYELSRRDTILLVDVCPQANLTEIIMPGEVPRSTIYQGLLPKVLGPAFGDEVRDLAFRASRTCPSLGGGKGCYFIPGDQELYSFPSSMYQQLQVAASQTRGSQSVKNLLWSLKAIIEREAKETECSKIVIDTSPFYAGATHLAWCACEALIVPVRVDEHSVESLDLMMRMLTTPERDFNLWNTRGGNLKIPKIAAIVMTMAGAKSQKEATPDAASRMYIERALNIAHRYPELFDMDDPADAFVITDDFMSSGRISGAKSTPISELRVGSFHTVEGRRLQVNRSALRYQKEIQYLASIL